MKNEEKKMNQIEINEITDKDLKQVAGGKEGVSKSEPVGDGTTFTAYFEEGAK